MKTLILFSSLFAFLMANSQSNFPISWLGNYEGEMYMEYLNGIQDTAHTSFELLETTKPNHWVYRMSYDSKKWGSLVKDYEIFWHDSLKSPNIFLLDEKDGIYIQEVFMNNKLCSHFEVENQHFISLLEQRGKNLYFEIRCTNPKLGFVSKSQADENEASYEVTNFLQYTVQYVLLKPKKKKKR